MATANDYLGKSFGFFTILEQIGHGAEAEVLSCRHEATGLLYILRLDVSDDALWGRGPLIPPRNHTLERKNARGTWLVAPTYYAKSLQAQTKSDHNFVFRVPAIYGVLDNRYLVPVASPVRVRSAWDVDSLLNATPRPDMERFLRACFQGKPDLEDINAQIRGQGLGLVDLPANLLLRLCFWIASRNTLKEAQATLSCQHFRVNISFQDVHEAGIVYAKVIPQTKESRDLAVLLDFVRAAMTFPPLDPLRDSSEFEIREQQPAVDRFDLYLQEHAGVHQQAITLEA